MNESLFRNLGATNHSPLTREADDFYATEPKAVELLLEKEEFNHYVLEPACGKGHITEVLLKHGYATVSFDIVDRGYNGIQKDFFTLQKWDGDIITNPPYKDALKFVRHALEIVNGGAKIAMFLRLQFLEGKERGKFFLENPPKKIYVASGRLNVAKNGEFEKYKKANAMAFAWYIWKKGYGGKPMVDWINV